MDPESCLNVGRWDRKRKWATEAGKLALWRLSFSLIWRLDDICRPWVVQPHGRPADVTWLWSKVSWMRYFWSNVYLLGSRGAATNLPGNGKLSGGSTSCESICQHRDTRNLAPASPQLPFLCRPVGAELDRVKVGIIYKLCHLYPASLLLSSCLHVEWLRS